MSHYDHFGPSSDSGNGNGSALRTTDVQGRSYGGDRDRVPPSMSFAAPGSSSGNMNPASTVAFMLNMGYPPPPIALEPLRRLVEQLTQGPGQILNLQSAFYVTDEITRSPYRTSPAVLFVLQQRLHSSKPDRVTLALELLQLCVNNCGLDFLRQVNREFMKSMTSVIKTVSATFSPNIKSPESTDLEGSRKARCQNQLL